MIRVACLLLLTARALAAPAPPGPDTAQLQQQPNSIAIDYEGRPIPLHHQDQGLIMKIKRSTPPLDNRKLIVKQVPCSRSEQNCVHTQLYEFNLFRVKPSENRKGVYY